MSSEECPTCHGQRLKPTSLAVTVGGINIAQFCDMSVNEELEFIQTAKVSERDEASLPPLQRGQRASGLFEERGSGVLDPVSRRIVLSGGESQRIRWRPRSAAH